METITKQKQLFLVDIGILLDKNDEEFKSYTTCYDKKWGYYDEVQYLCDTKDYEVELKTAKEYIKRCVNNSYIVITNQGLWNIEEGIDFNDLDWSSCDYSVDGVVYSIMKDKDGNIIENFIKKEESK